MGVTSFVLLHISSSWVGVRLYSEFQLPMLLKSGRFMVGDNNKQVSMKLMADQCFLFVLWAVRNIVQLSAPDIKLRDFWSE